eukprot:226509-Rhodomonas_salina.1
MGREPQGPRRRYTEADWARHNREEEENEEELPELRESKEERVRGINDDLSVACLPSTCSSRAPTAGSVAPILRRNRSVLPSADAGYAAARPSKVRPEMFAWKKEEEKRRRVRKELERKAILGEEDDDLDRKKEVWE